MRPKAKILILTPPIHRLGGVANHYKGLKSYWSDNVSYFEPAKFQKRSITNIFKAVYKRFLFILTLLAFKPHIVVVNISLKKGFFSKNAYIAICQLFKKKVLVFIHGWDIDKQYMLDDKRSKRILKCDGFFLLSSSFKNYLSRYVPAEKIFLTTTKVDDNLIKDFDINNRTGKIKNILFLSRIEKAKGIYEAVDTFAILKPQHRDLSLTFVGDGTELANLKKYVAEKHLEDVRFTGRLDGENVANEYMKADFFFFFSTHGEGMPTALLEAMAFGLPIATRPVGGIPDFFVNGEMGLLTESLDPNVYSKYIEQLINNPSLVAQISRTNYEYARTHFMASIVAKNMEMIFNKFI